MRRQLASSTGQEAEETAYDLVMCSPFSVIESFDDMALKEDLLRGIYSYGFEKPSAIQQRAIKPLLMMRDTIAQAQSGTGKTATFTIGDDPQLSV